MTAPLPIDPGLLGRLKQAYETIAWDRPLPRRPTSRRAGRVATLHDETARVETWGTGLGGGVVATSGPVGALVVLVEIDRRGPPRSLGSLNAGRDPHFPDGAIIASWAADGPKVDSHPTVRDLVDLARYALP